MKRILGLLLAVLLLAGCNANPVPATTTAPTSTGTPTVETTQVPVTEPDPGLYLPDSDAEKATNGAIRAYDMGTGLCLNLTFIGDDLVVCSYEPGEKTDTVLTLLRGENCSVAGTVALGSENYLGDGTIQINDNGVSYYLPEEGCIAVLDDALRPIKKIPVPDAAKENLVISEDRSTLYYCSGTEIRALNLETGIARLLKQNNCQWQKLTQLLFDGTVIACDVMESENVNYTAYISTVDGRTIGTDTGIWQIESWQDRYYLHRDEGGTLERLFGSLDGTVQSLNLQNAETDGCGVYSALSMNGVVTFQEKSTEQEATLSFFDLSTGRRTASVELPNVAGVYALVADPNGQYLWFLSYNAENNKDILYRWEPAKSSVSDETVYTGPRYTASNPDAEGLAHCQAKADVLGAQYGVKIVLWDQVKQPADYLLTYEYMVPAIAKALEELEKIMAVFPEGFVQTVSAGCGTEELQIGLVREISHDSVGVQYWLDGNAYIALSVKEDLSRTFSHELFHVIDSYVIGNSRAYDLWDDLNPKKFTYDYNYVDYMNHTDTTYLEGSKRAFIDAYSMTFPKEDRARIFEYAMMGDAGSEFQSDTMQKKLHSVCFGIREAFKWKKDERTFPWEQHLEKSLAYVKKK